MVFVPLCTTNSNIALAIKLLTYQENEKAIKIEIGT
jgi:hypothetical protein